MFIYLILKNKDSNLQIGSTFFQYLFSKTQDLAQLAPLSPLQ